MNDKLQEYFIRKKNEEVEKRNELLIELGLYEKEYKELNHFTTEYSEYEDGRYFKKVPIIVTDEEYSQIAAYEKNWVKKNPIATIIFGLSISIYIGGFILGIVKGINSPDDKTLSSYLEAEFLLYEALAYWVASFVLGSLVLGFSEIITLLDRLVKK